MDNQNPQQEPPSIASTPVENPVPQTVIPPPSKSFLSNKLILIVIISTFLLGGGILARHYFIAQKEKPKMPETEAPKKIEPKASIDATGRKTFSDRSGLVLKFTPTSKVEKNRARGIRGIYEDTFLIPEDKIEIRVLPNPFPQGIFDAADVGYSESSYFSLPGKFNWGTSPIYNFLSDRCVGIGNCSDNNPVEMLPLKRYESTNEANQKVGIVRYVSLNNKTTCINCDTILSFEKRYILDFDSVTIWVKFREPLLVSSPIPGSNTSKQEVQDFMRNSINKLNTDKNFEDKFATSDEFIRQVSVDKNGYAFFNMIDSISNNLCKPCRVEIQGRRMKLTQEGGNKFAIEYLTPDDAGLLRANPQALKSVIGKFKPIINSVEVKVGIDTVPEYQRNYMIRGSNLFGGVVHFNDIVLPPAGSADDYLTTPVSEAVLPKGNYEVFVENLFGESNKLNKRIEL